MTAWKDVAKNILKGSAVIVGTRFVTEKVVPKVTEQAKEAWEKIKHTKKTGKEVDLESEVESLNSDEPKKAKPTHKAAKMRVVNNRVYDAEYDGVEVK